jgi:hypothetical protein
MGPAMLDGHWHFHCPECATGDFELGCLADDQQLFCEVCLEGHGRLIRLSRWPAEEQAPNQVLLRPDLAA